MNKREKNNILILNDLLKYNATHPNQRFFQLLSNYFGMQYLGYAADYKGTNFRDLFHEECEIVSNAPNNRIKKIRKEEK